MLYQRLNSLNPLSHIISDLIHFPATAATTTVMLYRYLTKNKNKLIIPQEWMTPVVLLCYITDVNYLLSQMRGQAKPACDAASDLQMCDITENHRN